MVPLVAPFPDAVVGRPIGPGHVEHQVLDEVRFITALDHGAAAPRQLGQLQQKQRGGIQLQVAPGVIGNDGIAAGTVVFGMKRVQRIQAVLEALHLFGLAQHGAHQASHQGDHPLLQLPGPAVLNTPVAPDRQAQGPDALHGIDAVPDPGIAVVAMDGVGGACGQQATHGVLTIQDHPADRAIQPLDDGINAVPIGRDLR